jgi:hypothetical protein
MTEERAALRDGSLRMTEGGSSSLGVTPPEELMIED